MGLVGRIAELALLAEQWRAARRSGPRVVVVTGEAGIGKTSLLQEAVRRAAPAPARLVWAGCEPEEAIEPWFLLERLLPGVTPATSGAAATVHVAGAVARALRESGPTIAVVDDAQWADPLTMAALRLAVRRLDGAAVLLALAARTEHPGNVASGRALPGSAMPGGTMPGGAMPRGAMPGSPVPGGALPADAPTGGGMPEGAAPDQAWRRLLDSGVGARIALGGLSARDLVDLAAGTGRPRLAPAGAARLHAHTGGNPLHARHLLEEVPARVLAFGEGELPAPRELATTMRATLDRCSPSTRQALAAAAVLGRRFALADLAHLLDAPGDPAVAEAVTAGVLVEEPGTGGRRLAFAEPLLREVVHGGLGPASRRALHTRAAALGGPGALAHRIAGAAGPDAALAADLERLGRADLARGDIARAALHLHQSVELAPPGEAGTRLLLAVEALLVAGNVEAAARYEGAVAAAAGPYARYVEGYLHLVLGRPAQAGATLAAAAASLAAGDSGAPDLAGAPPDLAARIDTQLAVIAVITVDREAMVARGSAALAAAREPWVAGFAGFARALGLALCGDADRALHDLADAHVPRARWGLDGLVGRGIVRLWTDDVAGARADLEQALERAVAGEPLRVGQALGFLGDAEFRAGDVAAAVRHTGLALGDAEENGRLWDYPLLHACAGYPLAVAGEEERAQAHAEQAARWAAELASPASAVAASAIAAVLARVRGDAEALLVVAEGLDAAYPAGEPGTHPVGPVLAEALARLGRVPEAEAALAAYSARIATPPRPGTVAALAAVRARVMLARGEPDAAARCAGEAAATAAGAGLVLDAATAAQLEGSCLAAGGRRAAAERRFRAAWRQLVACGAHGLAARTLAEAHVAGCFPERPDAALDLLTPAERAVVLLACEGLSNREIAQRLVVSPKTVEYHLGNAYRRLEVRTRQQLREAVDAG